MTDFYAMYLFLVLAVIFLALGFWVKKAWIFWLSGLAWVVVGIYCFSVAGAATYIRYFAAFSGVAGLFCFIYPLYLKPKVEEPEEEWDTFESDLKMVEEERTKIKKLRGY